MESRLGDVREGEASPRRLGKKEGAPGAIAAASAAAAAHGTAGVKSSICLSQPSFSEDRAAREERARETPARERLHFLELREKERERGTSESNKTLERARVWNKGSVTENWTKRKTKKQTGIGGCGRRWRKSEERMEAA